MEILSVPGTNQVPKFFVTHQAQNEPYRGWVEDSEGQVIARLESFRFDFVGPHHPTPTERNSQRQGVKAALAPVGHTIDPFDSRISWHGEHIELPGYLKGFNGDDPAAHFTLQSQAAAIEVGLHAHGWSGLCRVQVNGDQFEVVDLFNREATLVRRVQVDNPTCAPVTVSVYPLARSHPQAQGRQVFLEYVREFETRMVTPVYKKHPAHNRGGAFSSRFFELLRDFGPDAVVLDVGGGKRQLDDQRYINLEYAAYEEPDILGDGTRLPFLDETIDFIYSAAVLEHVPDPLRMGREIHRVLKPGGKVLANSAFMQPVHSEGQHFFNLTPYGIDLTFSNFGKRKVWWDCGFSSTIEWMTSLTAVAAVVGQDKVNQFVALARDFDKHITNERAMYVASGVWLEGEK